MNAQTMRGRMSAPRAARTARRAMRADAARWQWVRDHVTTVHVDEDEHEGPFLLTIRTRDGWTVQGSPDAFAFLVDELRAGRGIPPRWLAVAQYVRDVAPVEPEPPYVAPF